ncbi:MAG: C2H2-type zinc finger protein [Vulcanisaeta sp.]|uniref:C2H2-type zinc finger protein n=1 Tax=Vulcanisaeta sp. TaxID=2020871 RepID=UPI003D11B43E
MYKCRICGKEFKTAQALGGHYVTAHNPELQGMRSQKRWLLHREEGVQQIRNMVRMREERRLASLPRLTEEQREIVLGTVLGDGYLSIPPPRAKNARLTVVHALSQYEYLMWKYSKLKNIVKSPPRLERNTKYGAYGDVYRFQTICHPELTEIYKVAYVNGRKTITREFLNMIKTPTALAVWFLDDGSISMGKNGYIVISLHTEGYTLEENRELVQWLKTNWDLTFSISQYRNYYFLHTPNMREAKKFLELIKPIALEAFPGKVNSFMTLR